jgi:subtilisin family serine protease
MKKVVLFVLLCCLVMIGVSVQAAGPQSYLIIASGTGRFPSNINTQISRAGGTVTNRLEAAGMITVSTSNPNFASRISGVMAVVPNHAYQLLEPDTVVAETEAVNAEVVNPPDNDGSYDLRYPLLWGLDAVNAPEAWEAGSTGEGVRVAVLDTGFIMNHPDLAPNINVALSADMTGEGISFVLNGTFSHGTHVAGTIAGARNDVGVIGVAYDAELVLVKVLKNDGNGTFEDIIEGIIYATNADADIINMSLGAYELQGIGVGATEIAALRIAAGRATTYAFQNGTTVIVSAGNNALNLDGGGSIKRFMGDLPHTISISATAPIGWAIDPNTDLDVFTSYSNYGLSGVDFSAPGGDDMYPGNENCLVGGIVRPCYVFDLVFSSGGYNAATNGFSSFWAAGTSMAAPHAAGIAALIIGENGGSMHPSQVRAELEARAEDLGVAGEDALYGRGAIRSGH